jgi:hypothetical protein
MTAPGVAELERVPAYSSWVRPVWLQPLRDRKPLKPGGKTPARGIAPRPEAPSAGHYSQPRLKEDAQGTYPDR